MNTILLAEAADPTSDILTSVQTAVTNFLGQYGPAIVAVIGGAIVLGLAVWAVPKLVGIFRKSAK